MISFRINHKALSVNECWQGKRYKTPLYKTYETAVLWQLPKGKINDDMLRVDIFFGFSSKLSDIDNGVKPLLDILQRKYSFNDKNIFEMNVRKCIVAKGDEFIECSINKMLPF